MLEFAMFVIGMGVGVVLFMQLNLWSQKQKKREEIAQKYRQEYADTLKSLEELTKQVGQQSLKNSVNERLQKAMVITAQQSQLDTRLQDQNILYNNLELEKLTILRSILSDGHDPVITIRLSTGDQQMVLSNYVASIQKTLH